ncbi:uncharacterized protein ACRADG_011408 isoform 2-T2 [Cochliomyia hominivorax]
MPGKRITKNIIQLVYYNYCKGISAQDIADMFYLKIRTVYNIISRAEREGRFESKRSSGCPKKLNGHMERNIIKIVCNNPKFSTRRLALQVEKEYGVRVSHETIRNVLQRYRYSTGVARESIECSKERSTNNIPAVKDEEDNECDLGYQVLSKATSNPPDEEDLKPNSSITNNVLKNMPSITAANIANLLPNYAANGGSGIKTSGMGLTIPSGGSAVTTSLAGTIMLPVPSLPTVQLPPSLTAKPILGNLVTSSATAPAIASTVSSASLNNSSYTAPASLATLTSSSSSVASQVFTLPQLSAKGPIPMPASNTASSVGCLIIEPQLFASADTFKKEFSNSSSVYSTSSTAQITPTGLQIYPNVSSHVSAASSQAMTNRLNPPLITKIRRVQPSPQSSAINLSFSSNTPSTTTPTSLSNFQTNGYTSISNTFMPPTLGGSTTITATSSNSNGNVGVAGPPPIKKLKSAEVDISAILQANRDLDANTLFFLSLARSVRSMPTKFQSLAKMRCMRIVSDIEMELDNISNEVNGVDHNNVNTKYCTNETDAPPPAMGNNINETPHSEHFVYVMSPSRVESMIDLSSDDENAANNG